MLSQYCDEQAFQFVKLQLAVVLFLGALVLPYQKISSYNHNNDEISRFTSNVVAGPTEKQPELPFSDFLHMLNLAPYSGTWVSSIKESKLLAEENGTILLNSYKSSESSDYSLQIQIFDGKYRDNGNYEILLNSSSIKTEQQFIEKQLIFETISPMIGVYRHGITFMKEKEKPIYINKLKFRLKMNETLQIELLLAAGYELNIVTERMKPAWALLNEFLFGLILVTQVFLQVLGIYWLLREVEEHEMIAKSISPTMIKLNLSFDTVQIFILCFVIYEYDMKILALPTYFLALYVFYLQFYLLSKINSFPSHPHPHTNLVSNETSANTSEENMNLLPTSPLLPLASVIENNENYIFLACSFFIFYVNNMNAYIYYIFYFVLLIPQIVRNIRMGSKVNYSLESILTYSCPRLIPILYLRFFGLNSLFLFETRYLFCLTIIGMVLICSLVLFIQKKYGARSILPKFLLPKGLKTKFKFFIIKDENVTCTICSSDLAELPLELRSQLKLSEEVKYNKVVLTPCHHKFHAYCLEKWMEKQVECPSCSCTLPPTDCT